MKNYALLFAAIISAVLINSCAKPNKNNPRCTGNDRWDVKTLSDPDTTGINFNPISTTVSNLITIQPQNTVSTNTPRFGIEFKTYTLQCHIREFKLSDDGDLHLVLVDLSDTSKTMIGEIPDPVCDAVQQSVRYAQIKQVRKDFQNTLLTTAQVDPHAIYTIIGVAFYDKVHGQLGVAPTGIEIHPVLYISKQ